MTDVFIGLGSNLQDPPARVLEALDRIRAHPELELKRCSSLYETQPVSDLPQPPFINAAALLQTALSPEALMAQLTHIAQAMGQGPKPKNAPRIIDIDILLFGDMAGSFGCVEVPHPRWKERLFVLKPLAEICDFVCTAGEVHDVAALLKRCEAGSDYWIRELEGVSHVALSHC